MKNIQLHKKLPKKKNKKKSSIKARITKIEALRQKAERVYQRLPKWAKNILEEDKDIMLNVLVHERLIGYDKDPNTGKIISMRNNMLNQAEQRNPYSQYGTKRIIFSAFRNQEPHVYTMYNNYMYRNGYSSAKYFYANAEVERQKGGYRITATLVLPEPKTQNRQKLSELTIQFQFITQFDYEVVATLDY